MDKRIRIVIAGNGFGGVYVARHLESLVERGMADITIIGRANHFLFTPLLHEVATGGLSPTSVVEPLHQVFRHTNIHCLEMEVEKVDLQEQLVLGMSRGSKEHIAYDYLVIASGAETNTYQIKGVAEHAYLLKTLADAAKIRNRIIQAVEEASETTDVSKRKRLLSFAVVGGGATGVELASEMVEFVEELVGKYYSEKLSLAETSVSLINAGPDLVAQFAPILRKKVLNTLTQKRISVSLNMTVCEVNEDGVVAKCGTAEPSLIVAGTVVWVAGVKGTPVSLIEKPGTPVTIHPSGRIVVSGQLQLPGYANVFALGDAATHLASPDGKPLPMLAQVAEQEAEVVAANIKVLIESRISGRPATLFPYKLQLKGMLLSLGQWQAVGDIHGFHFSGPIMWWVWRTTYLFKFLSWRKRFKIMFEWTVNLFSPRDITRV